jgi:ankyrin repeat protein
MTAQDIEDFIISGDFESLVETISKSPELVNCQLDLGFSPLFLAFNEKDYQICQYLIENGSKMEYINKMDNSSILMLIITWYSGHELERKVLEASQEILNHKDDEGNTALHYACYYENKLAIEELIKRGAKVNETNNKFYTPLMYLLIGYDPFEGLTKRTKVCTKKTLEIVKLLVDRGANTFMTDHNNRTAEDILWETKKLDKENSKSIIYGEIYYYVGT